MVVGSRVESERVQQPELGLLQDCVNIDGDTKGLPESLRDGSGDDDHPKSIQRGREGC